jgi:hypothetical protein
MFSPLPYSGPIQSVVGLVFFFVDLDIETKSQLADMVRFCGGHVVYKMSANVHFLVAKMASEAIVKIALEARIPIVRPGFIVEMVRGGCLPDSRNFGCDGIVKARMLDKLCKFITGANVAPAPEISVQCRKPDLEAFTPDPNSTQSEVLLEVRYASDL